jgi:hypothetical protein
MKIELSKAARDEFALAVALDFPFLVHEPL